MTQADWLTEVFQTIDRQDTQGFTAYFAEDGSFRFGNQPAVRGHRAIFDYVAGFFAQIAGISHTITERWEQPGSKVAEGEVTYTRKSGSQVTIPYTGVFRLTGDRIADYRIYIDIAPLFAAT